MVRTMEAVFDGKVLRPDDPVALEPNTRVRITIETIPSNEKMPVSIFKVAQSIKLDGPADWATNLEEYLYGGQECECIAAKTA